LEIVRNPKFLQVTVLGGRDQAITRVWILGVALLEISFCTLSVAGDPEMIPLAFELLREFGA
jgi:hypothetical protein